MGLGFGAGRAWEEADGRLLNLFPIRARSVGG